MAPASADAFALVGNEHRAAILRALLSAHADPGTPYPTPFAVLRERAGVDVSAQFAYHLDELVGAMLARTDDGYRLRYTGWKAAAALAAGTDANQPAFGPARVDGACPRCGAHALHASYGDAWVTVACHGCERVLTRYPFPPGAAAARLEGDDEDGDVEALLAAFDDRVRSHFALATDGVCPECAGPTTRSLAPVDGIDATDSRDGTAATDQRGDDADATDQRGDDADATDQRGDDADATDQRGVENESSGGRGGGVDPNETRGDGHALEAVVDCEQCGNHLTFPVGCVLLGAPAVVAWATANDVDLTDRAFWRVPELVGDAHVDQIGTDPVQATVSIPAAGDEDEGSDGAHALAVTVTAALDVHVPDDG